MEKSVIKTPVLVIGAGAAGARCAIEMKRNGIEPFVISKRDHGDAHTTWARGGVNASLGNLDEEDSWEIHAADTLDEGHYLNNPKAVECMSKEIPDVVEELDNWGMDFSRTDNEDINQRYFGAQSYRRTCFAGDYTGEAMLNTLVEKAQSLNISYKDNIYVTKIISDGSNVYGAISYDMESERYIVFRSDRVVLAAGGHTSLYSRHSSRDDENTGDGVGLAYDAGAELMDMEFVQFHPTGMSGEKYGEKWDGRLVTEAVRGEGGRLYNTDDERFMKEYSPKQMELDARDVVARAIVQEIREGRGTENNGVYLDISHKDKPFIKDRLPRMYERFDKLGVDISEEPMEVAPTAHYIMGGVKFDPETGETCVDNLHVLGETTAGVHGANRLGGNSLAETVSIGKIVGEYLSRKEPKVPKDDLNEDMISQVSEELESLNNLIELDPEVDPMSLVNQVRNTMEKHVGIRRTESELQDGLDKIENIEEQYKNISVDNRMSSLEYEMANNLKFMITAAKATIISAIKRKESRGAHYRKDFESESSEHFKNYIVFEKDNEMRLGENSIDKPSDKVQDAIDKGYELDYHHLE
jgi:succinate dehydrogenase / fumarate reductase flavoprotein subunit